MSTPSLFHHANRMLRDGRLADAILIYESLREADDSFPQYARNEAFARARLARHVGPEQAQRPLHLPKARRSQRRLRIAHLLGGLGDPAVVRGYLEQHGLLDDAQAQLALANAALDSDFGAWLQHLNGYLTQHRLAPVAVAPRDGEVAGTVFDRLSGTPLPAVDDGPLVSVCMSCFNAERYLEQAMRSILNQTHRNLELIVVDDLSTDATPDIIARLAREDDRVRAMRNATNRGTYVSRNQAFELARGEFFTVMDADDFALPERLARQVHSLVAHPERIGVWTDWVRMHEDGRFYFKVQWGGTYQHEAVATLMIRRREVLERVGYWDSVRFAADTEFIFRLKRVYGKEAVPKMSTPTVISLFHENSLTNDPLTGISEGGLSPVRQRYRDSWAQWHANHEAPLYMPFPLEGRLFAADREMLP
jgi:GT2 family glycosyltransferase